MSFYAFFSVCESFGQPVSKTQSMFEPNVFLDALIKETRLHRQSEIERYCHDCLNATLVTKQELKQIIP